jgi:hypothetical protein
MVPQTAGRAARKRLASMQGRQRVDDAVLYVLTGAVVSDSKY